MEAHTPAKYDEAVIHAAKHVAMGSANENQQRLFMDWLIKEAAHTYDLSYRPNDIGATSFAEGRRFVGLQIVKLLNMELKQHDNS